MESENRTPLNSTNDQPEADFEKESEAEDLGFLREFVLFLRDNKKWWLIPLVGSLLLLGLVSLLATSGAAPFIYTVF